MEQGCFRSRFFRSRLFRPTDGPARARPDRAARGCACLPPVGCEQYGEAFPYHSTTEAKPRQGRTAAARKRALAEAREAEIAVSENKQTRAQRGKAEWPPLVRARPRRPAKRKQP